jgi:hypothetical protein
MWERLHGASQGGLVSPLRDIGQLADRIQSLLLDSSLLPKLSNHARDFAAEHVFENEFKKRTDSLAAAASGAPA